MFNYENNVTEDDVEYGQIGTLYYRLFVETNFIQFGIRKYFDRWANSTDFEYHGITEGNRDIVMKAAQIAYEKGMYDREWGERRDLGTWYRQAKRLLKREASEANND